MKFNQKGIDSLRDSERHVYNHIERINQMSYMLQCKLLNFDLLTFVASHRLKTPRHKGL